VRYFKCHIILKITILDEQDPHWNEIEIWDIALAKIL
jgi:hypothetical protein